MKLKITAICAFAILLSPTLSHAFVTETEQVTRLSNDVWLYVNTAEYGSTDQEVRIPVATAPNWVPRINGQYLKYQVLLSDRPFAGLDTAAIVLSDAPIVDNQYVVPADGSYSFTLIALITIPNIGLDEQVNLSLEVTSGE